MITRLNLTIQIYRPLQQVFTFVTTPENDFQWQYSTLASDRISGEAIGVGTLFRTVAHFMGRRIESIYEVTEFEVDKKYGFTSVSGPVDSHTLYTFEMIHIRTKINISTEMNPRGVLKTANPIDERKFRKQHQENLALLKNLLETPQIAGT